MKLKSIQFVNHKILGNLLLDFCDEKGKPVDTIIIAGENGTGKSTLLTEIYKIVSYQVNTELCINLNEKGIDYKLEYYIRSDGLTFVKYNDKNMFQGDGNFKKQLSFAGIFSDVDINFHADPISSVTSMDIDKLIDSRKSNKNLTKEIQQLLIDIQNLDDSELSKKVRENIGNEIVVNDELTSGRMDRFINAFSYMFSDPLW